MKTRLALLLLICMVALFAGCIVYQGPSSDKDEIWIADDLQFYFGNINGEGSYGKTVLDGETIEISVACTTVNEVEVLPYPTPDESLLDKRLLAGELKRVKGNSYCIEIKDGDGFNKLFPGYEQIKLTKYDISEVEWVDGWPVPIEG